MPSWSRLLAAALPIGLSAVVVGALLAPLSATVDPVETDRELRRLAQHLDRVKPQMVVVGNSVAHRNLDRVALGEALGAADRVASLWLVGSDAPTWLVLLDRLLYARGHRPELVLVPAFPPRSSRPALSPTTTPRGSQPRSRPCPCRSPGRSAAHRRSGTPPGSAARPGATAW